MKDLVLKQNSITINDNETISVGDLVMDRDGVYPVIKFKEITYKDRDGKTKTMIKIVLGNHKFGRNGEYELYESDLKQYYTVVKGYSIDEIEDIADKIFSGEMKVSDLAIKESTEKSSSTSLMVMNKEVVENRRNQLKNLENKVSLIRSMVRQKTEAIRTQMNGILSEYNKVIKRLNSIIFTLELYAGVKEDIKQIQSGEPADDSEPIYLNQLMRYMDEEVGDPDNEGIGFDSIDKFDNWLLSYSKQLKCYYYELLLPQKKCVRTIRVRRSTKESYLQDSWGNSWEIMKDMKTYIMIRNGDNIYTINSSMIFDTKLFPDEEELIKILKLEDEDSKYDKLSKYKNGMILMQGLVDRTSVFGNIASKVSFLTTESQEKGDVVFQYELDEDKQITDGKYNLLDFMSEHPIKIGTRILIWNTGMYHSLDGYGRGISRFTRYYSSSFSAPFLPEDGIYELVEHKSENHPKGTMKFMYDAEGRYNNKTNQKTGWIVKDSDSNVVDIDSISHRNIDWITSMFYDRKLRRHYVRVMGALKNIKTYKLQELKKEEPFVLMMISKTGKSKIEVMDAVHWWKTKNKYKRPLSKDDKKAIRMISKHLKNVSN